MIFYSHFDNEEKLVADEINKIFPTELGILTQLLNVLENHLDSMGGKGKN